MIEATLSDADARVFTAIVNDERVVLPTSDLPFEREELGDALAALDVAGLIAAFEWGDAPAVSLTPLAAAGAGLRARRTRRGYVWVPASTPERPDRLPGRRDVEPVDPDTIADRREPTETDDPGRSRRTPRLIDRLVEPTVLLTGSRPWVNPERLGSEPCRACKGLPLGDRVYCLLCHRWGLDDVLTRLRAAEVRRVEAAAKAKPHKFRPRARRARV